MKSQIKGQTVFVAMSGGVDSSVAAALLKKRGFKVVGVFMKPWSSSAKASDGQATFCPWKQDREDALRVAAKLEIPLLTWDFSKEYKKSVADYMIREYKEGRTPNPDVMCNKEIKFGLFLKRALKEGADYIATGHYVRKLANLVARFEEASGHGSSKARERATKAVSPGAGGTNGSERHKSLFYEKISFN